MRLALPCLALLIAACATPATPGYAPGGGGTATANGAPTPRPSSPITVLDPTGSWVLTSKGDYPPGAVVDCNAPQLLNITYSSGEIGASLSSCVGTCSKLEALEGTYVDGEAKLTGKTAGNIADAPGNVAYDLTFDKATQHLVGTRNGLKVWAAPFLQPDDGSCNPSPTPQPEATIKEGTILPVGSF